MQFDDLTVGKRLMVGEGNPTILGLGPLEVRGSSYVEGPEIVGDPGKFSAPVPTELGTLMVGETKNSDMKPIPFYSLFVRTFARVKSFLKVDTLLTSKLIKADIIYARVVMASIKNFIIEHPTKENKKLVHSCLEGPENAVYVRGRITNSDEIKLPEYWSKLIDPTTITVSLTPIGSYQNICVKRFNTEHVILQTQPGELIDCFYHIFAERIDVQKLEVEID